MTSKRANPKAAAPGLTKCPTGIQGLDEITSGGLPSGRASLVCGGPGSGKTFLGVEFLLRGALQFNEPGVFMAFEETAEELAANFASLGNDLNQLMARKKIYVDFVAIDRSKIEETGEYNLEGLFIRLKNAIETVGAKRVVLDTIEALFAGLKNQGVLRSELRRLFHWLKTQELTSIVTAERGEGSLTRQGLEEYVADCVVLLDNRIIDQIATRRLRIMKYRGSSHGMNEYPFLIGAHGLSVLPITSLGMDHAACQEHISTGVALLDEMMGGRGYFRGSTVLITGTPGTGKTSLAASFAQAACARGERCLYFSFEESPQQLVRNMRSIGLDLQPWMDRDLLHLIASRPSLYGLEMHLATMHDSIRTHKPGAVIFDPITDFNVVGTQADVKVMLRRLIDFLKAQGISALLTSLTATDADAEASEVGISPLTDTWILLRNLERGGARHRLLYILKSRGMSHSQQVHEFMLTDQGIQLSQPPVDSTGAVPLAAKEVGSKHNGGR